jgi:SNF2 family DNA or RNA helicase
LALSDSLARTASSTDRHAFYNFPGVDRPFDHQRETFQWAIDHLRCFVFDDIGTGKTFSVAWAGHYLIKTSQVNRVLVIAPVSTLTVVWKRTLFHVDPRLDVRVLRGTATQKVQMYESNPSGISIINPDSLHILAGTKFKPDMIIVDESAMFRQQTARRSKALKKICEDVKRVVMMTGEPTPEAATDVWFTARIVCPERVPRYFSHMRDMLMVKRGQWRWENKPDAQKILGDMLKGYVIRHDRSECLDLPPTQTVTHEVSTTADVKRLLKELKDEAAAQVEAGMITAANEAVSINKMLQVVSGAVKASNEEGRNNVIQKVDVKPKLDALADLINASRQPIIIYSEFIGALAHLSMWLREHGVSFHLVIGDTSKDKRVEAFDSVQRGEVKVLLAHPKAMAHGITLTTSNVVVWWTPIYSHEIYKQASGRITRATQTRKTYIVHLVMSALERRVLKRLTGKQQFQSLLFDYLASDEQ